MTSPPRLTPSTSAASDYRHPVWLGRTAIFALGVSFLLMTFSVLTWTQEGNEMGLWLLPIWLLMAAYWLRQWIHWTTWFQLADAELVIWRMRSARLIARAEITGVALKGKSLKIETASGTVRLPGHVNLLARVSAALDGWVPRSARPQPVWPCVVSADWMPPLFMCLFGAFLLALGVSGLIWSFSAPNDDTAMQVFQIVFMFTIIALGLGQIVHFLWRFVWRYRFDDQQIEVRTTLRTHRYDPRLIKDMLLTEESVTYRGITRILVRLRVTFCSGQLLIIQPGAQNYPWDYAEVVESYRLTRLLAQLRSQYGHYLRANA
ncbi:hypothetical protein GC175_33390 [bacterium]|nr:hypothetical protein [bacterium]